MNTETQEKQSLITKDLPPHIERRGDVLYFRKRWKGKRIYRSLDTNNAKRAEAKAKEWIKLLQAGKFFETDDIKVRKGYPTIGTILDEYERAATIRALSDGSPSEKTVRHYEYQIHYLLKKATNCQGKVENLCSSILTRKLVKDYIAAEEKGLSAIERLAKKVTAASGQKRNELFESLVSLKNKVTADALLDDCEGAMRVLRQRKSRSIHSILKNARAIFSPWAMDAYRDEFKLPNIHDFMTAASIKRAPYKYHSPPQELIDKTIEEGRKLRTSNPELYVVFCLCYDIAMRAGEATWASAHWLQERTVKHSNGKSETVCCMEITDRPSEWAGPKHGSTRVVPLHRSIYDELKEIIPAEGYLLPGSTAHARHKIIDKTFAAWMRKIGWNAFVYPKAAHELRKLMGSRWITEYPNPGVAQKRLGHKDLKTTIDFYGDFMDKEAALDPLMGAE